MPTPTQSNDEPRPVEGVVAFEEGDLRVLSEALSRDPQYNDRRLVVRRKLAALAKSFTAAKRTPKLPLDSRTSLHAPHAFNGKRVRRIWAYICRNKQEKGRLRKVVGSDLAKDLDAAFRNAYLCLAVEAERLEVSLRIHADAWFDATNLKRRVDKEGPDELIAVLKELDGFTMRIADWKGEWPCGGMDRSRLKEFLGFWEPGTHALSVERVWPAPPNHPAREALFTDAVPEALVEELERLVPLYRYAAWSKESDHLFG